MIKPVGQHLLVELINEGASSIILLNPEKPQKGKVISVGNKVTDVKADQVVSFASYVGTEIQENNTMYLLLHQKDILAYE